MNKKDKDDMHDVTRSLFISSLQGDFYQNIIDQTMVFNDNNNMLGDISTIKFPFDPSKMGDDQVNCFDDLDRTKKEMPNFSKLYFF